MSAIHSRFVLVAAGTLLAAVTLAQPAQAQQTDTRSGPAAVMEGRTAAEPPTDTRQLVQEAAEVVKRMKIDPELAKLLDQTQGIFIVPNFMRGALLVGGRGGEGVMLARQGGVWSGPVFYNAGGMSIGLQAGVEAGSVAFLLMNDKAVDAFKRAHSFTLSSEAGFSIADYTAATRAAAGERQDVIAWSDTEGLFAGAAVGVRDIGWDEEETIAYYGTRQVTPRAILTGEIEPPSESRPIAQALKKE